MDRSFKGRVSRIAMLALISGMALVTQLTAQVTLSSKDGTFSIKGTLERLEDGFYVLGTPIGQLTVHSELVKCDGETCPKIEPDTPGIRIAVSENFNPAVVPALVRRFYEENELGVQIAATDKGEFLATIAAQDGNVLGETQLLEVSESEAFELYKKGDVDVVFATRRRTIDELPEQLAKNFDPSTQEESEKVIGSDAVVVVVSPENPVSSLSIEQITGIFSGIHKNWSEVGGSDLPITVYAPPDDTPVPETFRRVFLDPALLDFDPEARRNLSGWVSMYAIVSNPGAIGLVRLSHASQAKTVTMVDACGMEADANNFTILSENYPLTQRLYVYTQNNEDTLANDFVEFSLGEEGQKVLDRSGYIGIEPEVFHLNSIGSQFVHNFSKATSKDDLENLTSFGNEVLDAERLSISFRFGRGSSQLDKKARSDVGKLLELLAQPAYQESEVMLVGFTDSVGKSSLNNVLSKRRAEQVLSELKQSAGETFKEDQFVTLGYGESFPVSCNDDEIGRDLNRRVEVWLR